MAAVSSVSLTSIEGSKSIRTGLKYDAALAATTTLRLLMGLCRFILRNPVALYSNNSLRPGNVAAAYKYVYICVCVCVAVVRPPTYRNNNRRYAFHKRGDRSITIVRLIRTFRKLRRCGINNIADTLKYSPPYCSAAAEFVFLFNFRLFDFTWPSARSNQ